MPADLATSFSIGFDDVVRTLVVGTLGYFSLLVLVRVTGKRSLSKFNAFDFVVTISIGSILGSMFVLRDITYPQGVLALALLLALQFAVSKTIAHSVLIENAVKAKPTLLLYRGRWLEDELRRERITKADVRSALRLHGRSALDEVEAVVFESEGKLSIVFREGERARVLRDVEMPPWAEAGYGLPPEADQEEVEVGDDEEDERQQDEHPGGPA